MKKSITHWIAGIVTILLAMILYFTITNTNTRTKGSTSTNVSSNNASEMEHSEAEFTQGNHALNTRYSDNADSDNANTLEQASTIQKSEDGPSESYNEDWCSIDFDLQEEEQQIARTELKDWQIRNGYAVILPDAESFISEQHHPNNQFVSPYQELPIEQLEELALNHEKWAMVAYMQRWDGNSETKDQLVEELLVLGAMHYALEHAVISHLSFAKTSLQLTGRVNEEAIEHLVNAIVYATYGVKNFNLSGMQSYLAIVSGEEIFQEALNPSLLVNELQSIDIENRLAEFSDEIDQERKERAIELGPVPIAAKKDFEYYLGHHLRRHRENIEVLKQLSQSNQRLLAETDCIQSRAEVLAKLDKMSEDDER